MLDYRSSISLIKESLINGYCVNQDPPEGLNLVSAAGKPISVIGKVVAPMQVDNIHTNQFYYCSFLNYISDTRYGLFTETWNCVRFYYNASDNPR